MPPPTSDIGRELPAIHDIPIAVVNQMMFHADDADADGNGVQRTHKKSRRSLSDLVDEHADKYGAVDDDNDNDDVMNNDDDDDDDDLDRRLGAGNAWHDSTTSATIGDAFDEWTDELTLRARRVASDDDDVVDDDAGNDDENNDGDKDDDDDVDAMLFFGDRRGTERSM